MRRRDFLKVSGTFFATAALGGLDAGCGKDEPTTPADMASGEPAGTYLFAEGVASGDPHDTSVVLWTRATRKSGTDAVILLVEVSTAQDFATVVVSKMVTAAADADYTVRVIVDGLAANTTYYYRFTAGADRISGRTRTAPKADDATTQVNLAWSSCQDYQAGFYGAWRRMLNDDMAAAAADQLHAVVFLGDFIYETQGDPFQLAVDDEFNLIELKDKGGTPRLIDKLPDGGTDKGSKFALTVADYRHMYRQFLRDADLREARARWPFITVWDDHEFTNDCWQTQANYDNATTFGEASQKRRLAASQVFFEYHPLNLTAASDVAGVTAESKAFADPGGVTDAQYGPSDVGADNFITEKNNAAAIGALTIYRSFRFGKHVELVMTDERSYRSDHAIPEEVAASDPFIFDPRNALPINLVNTFDAGKTANGGNPPSMVDGKVNVRKDSPPGTMLGSKQKAWWKSVMQKSDATWKIWGSEVMLGRLYMDTEDNNILPGNRIADGDAWDGYPGERNELMKHLVDNDIRNVVAITGDLHATFACTVYDNFDDPNGKPALVEFVAGGISSNTMFSFYESATRAVNIVRKYIAYDATKLGGTVKVQRNLNTLFLWGAKAAGVAADTNDIARALAARAPKINPHLVYADTDARGYGLLKITGAQVSAQLITVPAPITDLGTAGSPIKCKASWTLTPTPAGQRPKLDPPALEGTKPFPLV